MEYVAMTTDESHEKTLTHAEQARLDELLAAARGFHHLNCLVAIMAIAIASISNLEQIHIPGVDLALSRAPAAVALYTISIALAIASDRMFRLAYPWLRNDSRRIGFAWYALGSHNVNIITVTLWLVIPVVLTSIAATIALPGTFQDMSLLVAGFFLAATPRVLEGHTYRISSRLDHRGGEATLSIWLLYWYRLARNIVWCLLLILLLVAAVPSIRPLMLRLASLAAVAWLALLGLRGIGGFMFRRIDRIGGRFGFPTTNAHDYSADSARPV